MSPSKSPNKAFYRALGLVIAGLSIGILVLALLVTTSGPWVRQVVVQNSSGDGAASVDQGLTVLFDRPIEGTDFASAVEIEPQIDYTVSHRNQQLNITFNQNLLSDTDYVLTVKPMLEDGLGKRMEQEYTYEFATAEPSYTYLERNSGSGAIDKVIEKAPLSQKSHVLFGAHGRIKSFARNANYLAVVLARADNTDELRVIDLGTREERPLDIPHDVRIDNLRFSPVDNQFVFITQGGSNNLDASDPSPEASGDKLYRYDINNDRLQSVDSMSDKSDVTSALYSRDGQALLYRTLDGEYYLGSAAQTTEPTLLGDKPKDSSGFNQTNTYITYQDSGGFNQTNTKLAFLYSSGIAIYDAQTGGLQKTPDIRVGGTISNPTFLHNSDDLIYLRKPLDSKTGEQLEVCTANTDGKVEEQVVGLQSPRSFFDEPAVSYDDRYVLIETAPDPQISDDYVGHAQPKDAQLVLYDRFDGKVIESGIHGIDPVWSR